MRKFPLPFNTGDQTTIVDGIGPTIAKRLTQEMQRRGIGKSDFHSFESECAFYERGLWGVNRVQSALLLGARYCVLHARGRNAPHKAPTYPANVQVIMDTLVYSSLVFPLPHRSSPPPSNPIGRKFARLCCCSCCTE